MTMDMKGERRVAPPQALLKRCADLFPRHTRFIWTPKRRGHVVACTTRHSFAVKFASRTDDVVYFAERDGRSFANLLTIGLIKIPLPILGNTAGTLVYRRLRHKPFVQ